MRPVETFWRLLVDGDCTSEGVADALGYRRRTLQRRLRKEGQCFEAVRDSVRRDAALRYLQQPDVPLNRVAQMLGYSEGSLLVTELLPLVLGVPRKLRRALIRG
jgi:AraC-like DNA-binding protein